jgi:hypothetical protein
LFIRVAPCRGATWSGQLTFPRATGFAHAAEVAFWSGPQAAAVTAQEHLAAAREAIRLFGDRLRPFGPDAEILPGVRIVDAAGHTPGHSAVPNIPMSHTRCGYPKWRVAGCPGAGCLPEAIGFWTSRTRRLAGEGKH